METDTPPESPEATDSRRVEACSAPICSPLASVDAPPDCEHPCPFCGSFNLEETLWRGKLMISCNDCQSTGPWASSWQEAMEDDRPRRRAWELWNRRAIHAEDSGKFDPSKAINDPFKENTQAEPRA